LDVKLEVEILIYFSVFVLGLCFGSFVNMLVFRTALRYKILKFSKSNFQFSKKKRSFCDFCGRQLRWYENIPVVSWIVQKGKSRCCGKKLPVSYPLVEIGTGVLFVIFNFQFLIFNSGNILGGVMGIVVITLLVLSAVFDARYMILPDFSTYILIGLAFFGVVFDEKDIVPYLVSALGAAGFLGLLYLATKGKGMGLGDVKFAVFMGLFLGWPKILVAFYLAFIVGAGWGLGMMLLRRMKRKSLMPFGPFLIGATLVSWWWGEKIWYSVSRLW